jgi:hypothetical protein
VKENPDCGVPCEGAELKADPELANGGAGLGVVVSAFVGRSGFEDGTCGATNAPGKKGFGVAGVVD